MYTMVTIVNDTIILHLKVVERIDLKSSYHKKCVVMCGDRY